MRNFIERALNKLPKLDEDQIRSLILDIADQNELLEVVLDSLSDGVLVSDVNNRLVICNKSSERMLPMASGDCYDKLIWEVIDDDEISSFIRRSLENQESVKEKEFTLDSSPKAKILSFTILPMVKNGHIQGNILHIEDVSDKRSREARLRRAESLASLTTLAAGVAHEIKNPLGSIGIHIQLIQKAFQKKNKPDKEAIDKYIQVVNEEVERLNKIVVDFLFAVRPIDVKLEEDDINRIICDLLDFLQYELKEADIELKVDLAEEPPMLQLDEKYLKQALLNIIKNAISAMPSGGVLRIQTEKRNDDVMLHISDTGVGMSEEVMGKIFEPYFTTKDFGSGIGLTLVYKVIKEHLGDISVSSELEKGTTFTLSFPIPQREKHLLSWKGVEDEV